jgi:DNA-3-methyladenine glycosylase
MLQSTSLYNKFVSTTGQLSRSFFAQNTLIVAESLIGMQIFRIDKQHRLSGKIMEVEAYRGEDDLGCHARVGRTKRTEVMYGPAGHAYVYFTYGMHWMLNIVCEQEGYPAAVLIRAIEVKEGAEIISKRRINRPTKEWTNGPAKICQAFNIDNHFNGYDLCKPNAELFIGVEPIPQSTCYGVTKTPRVGLDNVPEPWKSVTWRFIIDE